MQEKIQLHILYNHDMRNYWKQKRTECNMNFYEFCEKKFTKFMNLRMTSYREKIKNG